MIDADLTAIRGESEKKMKSRFNKIIKVFDKSDRVIMDRYGLDNGVLITNGYVMIYVPMVEYTDVFMRSKPYYVRLAENQHASYEKGREIPFAANGDHTFLKEVWDKTLKSDTTVTVMTGLKCKHNKTELRLGSIGVKYPIAVNNDFYEACIDISDTPYRGTTSVDPIQNEQTLILPVRFGDELLEDFNIVNAAINHVDKIDLRKPKTEEVEKPKCDVELYTYEHLNGAARECANAYIDEIAANTIESADVEMEGYAMYADNYNYMFTEYGELWGPYEI